MRLLLLAVVVLLQICAAFGVERRTTTFTVMIVTNKLYEEEEVENDLEELNNELYELYKNYGNELDITGPSMKKSTKNISGLFSAAYRSIIRLEDCSKIKESAKKVRLEKNSMILYVEIKCKFRTLKFINKKNVKVGFRSPWRTNQVKTEENDQSSL
ncbi:hypothetical protein NECAME_06317 [Necator americanus]|uniref:Uncharacterized protein n=1 Tax=Necator americanus TaxID=51031 RepID=W2TVD4_NECAM|nr:hypothetical protein NECAME_06317 [Necator americanus]ETN85614.1 hypothetical protein NECAME_06317 [Necator americanus]